MWIVPESDVMSVDRIWTAVVFPAPFGPSSEKTVPAGTCRSTPSRTTLSPNDLRSPAAAIADGDDVVFIDPSSSRVALVATTTRGCGRAHSARLHHGFR